MNSEKISLARELLLYIEPDEVISTQVNHLHNTQSGFDKFPAEVIQWLTNARLLVLADIISISQNCSIEVFKVTELGEQLAEFVNLAQWFNDGSDEQFLKTGESIHKVLQHYHDFEVGHLVDLITEEEQQAYNNYYRIAFIDNVKTSTVNNQQINTIPVQDPNVKQVITNGLNNMFQLSYTLGIKGSNETRTNDYVFKKCMEELGEMALEDQIANGLSYKEPGADGVAGEAVDLAICAMDMFALQHPNNSPEEIQFLFLNYMNKKLEKWKQTISPTTI